MAESSYTLVAPIVSNAAPPETVGLFVRLFGPMEVRVAGHPLPRLRSRKGLWLLALLALRGGNDVERDWLAATLWPDCHEADARRSLRQSLHDLRSALGAEADRLVSQTPRTLQLDVSPGVSGIWVDLHQFDAAMVPRKLARTPNALENAVNLYRGHLLEDCDEDWVLDARRQREMHYLSALETLASAASAVSGHGASADYLRRAVAAAPLREDLQRALMEALAAGGNLPAALLVFRQFRAQLWQETASEPDAQTAALYRRLRDEARKAARIFAPAGSHLAVSLPTAAAEADRAILPQPRTLLIGREADVEAVVSCFSRARLVTLTGTGGIGKTRLALRAAEILTDEFEGGARFVDLATLTDPAAVPEAVAKALDITQEGREPLTHVLCRALSTRRLLLVLDNCEQVLHACGKLTDALLSTCSGVRILATSRQSLGLKGETVWRVPSLMVPPPSANNGLEDYAAAQLFVARARETDPTFQITARNAPTIARVCRRLDGIPLALELAAARLRALTVEEIDARLNHQFRLLTGGDRTALPRQQTLRGALDWSWNLLTTPEKNLLADLSVFAGGWTLQAAEAVCARSGLDAEEVLEVLTALIDKSLVVADKQVNGTTRYRLLETVRQYGRERLSEYGEPEAALVCTRHQTYFADLAAQIAANIEAQKAATQTQIETEYDNFRVTLDWEGSSFEDKPHAAHRALSIAGSLMDFWRTNGYLREGQERLRTALFRAERWGDTRAEHQSARARALYGLAALLREQGDYAQAQRHYEEALSAYRHLNDTSNVAAMLGDMGLLAQRQSDFDSAQALYEEGLALYRTLHNQRCIGISLSALGVLLGDRGELSQARAYLEEALSIHRAINNPRGVAVALNNLGINAREQGDSFRARGLFEDALFLHRDMKNARSVAITLINLGGILSDLGDYAEARARLQEALVFFQDSGNKDATATTLTALGMAATEQGDTMSARAFLTSALKLHRELHDRKDTTLTVQALAAVEAQQGRPENALRLWGAAEKMQTDLGTPLPPNERSDYEKRVAHARAALGDLRIAGAAWAEGQAMDFDTMCQQALTVS